MPLAALTGLTYLDLAYNTITSLPTELGALTGLEYLNLRSNDLTSVPAELGALTGLTFLGLNMNAIPAVPSELAALTGLRYLGLGSNQLTGVPTEFRTWGPSVLCDLYENPYFSCANVGYGTTCCTGRTEYMFWNIFGNNCGEGLPGGPCYTG